MFPRSLNTLFFISLLVNQENSQVPWIPFVRLCYSTFVGVCSSLRPLQSLHRPKPCLASSFTRRLLTKTLSMGHQTSGRRGKTSGLHPDVLSVQPRTPRCLGEGQGFTNHTLPLTTQMNRCLHNQRRAENMDTTHCYFCTSGSRLLLSFRSAARLSSKMPINISQRVPSYQGSNSPALCGMRLPQHRVPLTLQNSSRPNCCPDHCTAPGFHLHATVT